MQLARNAFMLWALRGNSPSNFRNFQRIGTWHSASAVLWLIGAFQEPTVRMMFWAGAFAIEFAAPAAGFWVPGLGRSTTADWDGVRRSYRGAMRPVHHHSARRIRSHHRRDICRAAMEWRSHCCVCNKSYRQHRDVVDLLPYRRGTCPPCCGPYFRSRTHRAARLHLCAYSSGGRASSSAPSPTSSC